MPKDSSAKYYQNNKERQQKNLDIKVCLKKKRKRDNMVGNDTKIYQKMKAKLVEHRKIYYEMKTRLTIITGNYYFTK